MQMNCLRFTRCYFGICVSVAMLTGCSSEGGTLNPSPAGPAAERIRASVRYSVLYSFKGASGDGIAPEAGLINVKGTLYGTTVEGGANELATVFAITTSGKETVLHSFGGSGDGYNAVAGLLDVKDKLYGTTAQMP
jgi:uncharacterized repeat protein (TIGR03803 family)